MKKSIFSFLSLLLLTVACNSKKESFITVTYHEDLEHPDTLFVEKALISQLVEAGEEDDIEIVIDTVVCKKNSFVIPVSEKEPASYTFRISDLITSESIFTVYAAPGEDITINFTSLSPVKFTATGSELMEGIAEIKDLIQPVNDEYVALARRDDVSIDQFRDVAAKFVKVHKDYIKKHPESAAAVYALNEMSGDVSFEEIYESLTPKARLSIFYPFVKAQYNYMKEVEKEEGKTYKRLEKGEAAPDFTLVGLDGTSKSLSEFRGKWLVLDFWGSWCGWCIKGFPALKEAYAKYHPAGLEVIGIDCNDSKEDWKSAVEQYKLPWVQLYNGDDNSLLENYGIQGFPTKIIINPKGEIENVTVGEDPGFFTTLARLIQK